ncbi:MAG: hypothetical protein F4185_05045 [Chloroflexi bacterium]|nr:hypothetical protein [Chloroflexota bacterium]MYA51573.1 hypothetical protein [Chloroflexota bacterium]MYB85315.1 hypothetical protein [Chloroflexota bacterium]MYF65282.1 hypothetical protein [Chloroflexota bacterium]MYK35618.1 hypothetical protein [Chloroflexota bacterium]
MFVIAAIAALIAGGFFYYRAYREARMWREVHVVWGAAQKEKAVAIHHELTQRGIRAQLKTTSAFDITRSMPQSHASIRVHRDDFTRAAQIVLSFTRG